MTTTSNNFEFTVKGWVKINNLATKATEWKVEVKVKDLLTNVITTIYIHEDNTNSDTIDKNFRFTLSKENQKTLLDNRKRYKDGTPCNLIAELAK